MVEGAKNGTDSLIDPEWFEQRRITEQNGKFV